MLHHTLPLGVTVALHQACLVAENGSISGGATSRPTTDRLIGSRGFEKEGTKAWKGLFIHLCQMWRDKLFEHFLLWTFSQAEAGGRLTRAPFLWWMNGCAEDPFLPQEHPSQFLSASNFYNSRGVTVGWFDSKIVIFLLQNCLGQNQLLAESLPQNGTGSPGGRMYPPHPSLARPACLSRGCPLLEKLPCRGSLQLLPHQACATRLRVHWGCVWLSLLLL